MRNKSSLYSATGNVLKKRKFSPVLAVLGCLIALVILLTIVVGTTDLSSHLHQRHSFQFTKEITKPRQQLDQTFSIDDIGNQKLPNEGGNNKATSFTSSVTHTPAPPMSPAAGHNTPAVITAHDNFSSSIDSSIEATLKTLQAHPLFAIMAKHPQAKIENVLIEMQKFDKCVGKPLIITMAKIGTPLYWQLVQNFVYSMAKFDIVECALMICISDLHCMNMCQHSSFPCYQYDDHSGDISAFQKIANLKLHAVPLAAAKGVRG
jgi:hypothetical protein